MAWFMHYGTRRHSGRYPWGSGEDPKQSGKSSVIDTVDALRRKGLSEKAAAKEVGMSIADIRAQRSLERAEKTAEKIATAQKLKAKGMSYTAIGEQMGINESSVRSLLAPSRQETVSITKNTANMLKSNVDNGSYVDIGTGIEAHLGISKSRLDTAVKSLKNQGYEVHNIQVDQLGTDKKTTVKVLTPPGTTYKDVVTHKEKIILPNEHTEDGGRTYLGIKPPVSISSKRVKIVHNGEGGENKDGLIEIRRGVADIALPPGKKYAQVRIAVDDTHYLKGMAVYNDKLPKGVDLQFNTSKNRTANKLDSMKPIKDDPENPFGSSIKQYNYHDASGKKHQSVINIVGSDKAANEEGRWGEWSKTLSSQILSKQPNALAKQQLDIALRDKKLEYDDISSLTNPAVKRRLLGSLADDADAAAVHLKAAAMPRQMNHVILPVVSMRDDQVYAPNYRNGEKVVLLRHPHGGKFEIPELTVNNNHAEARKIMGRAEDAIGISPKVAKRLSGADFDGDTVLVIPNKQSGTSRIHTSAPLEGLKDFDPISSYPHVEGMAVMTAANKQKKMGDVSNLITDMTIKGASPNEIARAVRHSMVVIDAEKHKLNYKLSEIDNGIPQLKEKYQGKKSAGASTLISKASSEYRVPHRKEGSLTGPVSTRTGKPTRQYVDPKTGKKLYQPTGETYLNKSGKVIERKTTTTKMDWVDDAHKLSSGTTMEAIYAGYANSMKGLANRARKDALHVKNIPYSPDVKRRYSKEVVSLNTKLKAAVANRPLERRAQLLANEIVSAKRKSNPHLSKEDLKKLKGQALTEARNRVGAKKPTIIITPKEWAAIQKGAISPSKLEEIINNADLDTIRSLATPRPKTRVSAGSIARAKSLQNSGYTVSQIADQLGVSPSTARKMLKA